MRRRINQHIRKNATLQILGGEEFYLELVLVPTWDRKGQRNGSVDMLLPSRFVSDVAGLGYLKDGLQRRYGRAWLTCPIEEIPWPLNQNSELHRYIDALEREAWHGEAA